MSLSIDSRRANPVSARMAKGAEAQAISELINQAFVVERPIFGGNRINARQVRSLLDKGKFLVIEDADGLAGCVYVELRNDSGYVGLLSARPSLQGLGIGRKLMEAAEAWFRETKCTVAELRVISARTSLPAFYRHLGYAETHTSPLPADIRPRIPCHYIHMSKQL